MALEEICKKLNLSENTIKHAFKRTQKNLTKKGLILIKKGYGKQSEYFLTISEKEIMYE